MLRYSIVVITFVKQLILHKFMNGKINTKNLKRLKSKWEHNIFQISYLKVYFLRDAPFDIWGEEGGGGGS